MPKFYSCSCFLKKNIYIKRFDRHFTFENDEQFRKDYKQVWDTLLTEEERNGLLEEIKSEIDRRKSLEEESLYRKNLISERYTPLHKGIFTLQNDFFDEQFQDLLQTAIATGEKSQVLSKLQVISKDLEIYSFPIFKETVCEQLVKEFENFELSSLPKGRPNSMNQYGILLDELGFEGFTSPLVKHYVGAIAEVVFPDWCIEEFDTHRAFIVSYKIGQDVDLGCHYDNAEVTLNVCLGKQFTAGQLYFKISENKPSCTERLLVQQRIGHAILHKGRQLHGTVPIESGERHNMIIWMRSSGIRNELCPMCNSRPDLIPSKRYGDGFTLSYSEGKQCDLM